MNASMISPRLWAGKQQYLYMEAFKPLPFLMRNERVISGFQWYIHPFRG